MMCIQIKIKHLIQKNDERILTLKNTKKLNYAKQLNNASITLWKYNQDNMIRYMIIQYLFLS